MEDRSPIFRYSNLSDEQLKSKILNLNNINILAEILIKTLKKTNLRSDEKQHFLKFLKDQNYKYLNEKYNGIIKQINNRIITLYITKLNTKKEYSDVHEILKLSIKNKEPKTIVEEKSIKQLQKKEGYTNTANLFTQLSMEQLIDFTRIVNYQSLWKDSHIIVDSRYRNLSFNRSDEISFNFIQNTKQKIEGSGSLYAHGETRQIIEIEIPSFKIPFVSNADNYYRKITLTIKEFLSVSYEAYEDAQFHFMFNAVEEGNLIRLDPIYSTFRFYKPISHLGDFTLRFGSPLATINFDKDRLNTTLIDYSTNPIELTFGEEHNLLTGDLVYITDFTTLNPAADLAIINLINRKEGHICTRMNSVRISIIIDGTSITSPDLTHFSNVFFGSKRIIFPLKFKYLLNTINNDI